MEQSHARTTQKTTVSLQPLADSYRRWAHQLLEREWGSCLVVSRGRSHDASLLPGFVATRAQRPVGLITYCIEGHQCELVTLNSLVPRIGVGTALTTAVMEEAEKAGCWRLWLVTSNDNVPALRFYQQRGFSLAALHQNAMATSRKIKPEIPLIGMGGIPIRHEIELEMMLEKEGPPQIIGLHHAMITIPMGEEAAGRHFYCEILGLPEVEKPKSLNNGGGFWVKVSGREVHVGIEERVNRASMKAHLAYQVTNIAGWRERLQKHGIEVKESIPIPDFERFELQDPFGNRIEFIERG